MDTASDGDANSNGISCYAGGVPDFNLPAAVRVAMGTNFSGSSGAVFDYFSRGSAGEDDPSGHNKAVGRDLFRTTCATCARALGDGGDIAG